MGDITLPMSILYIMYMIKIQFLFLYVDNSLSRLNIFTLCNPIQWARLNPLPGRFWLTGYMFEALLGINLIKFEG